MTDYKDEIERCKNDPAYFAKKYVKISDGAKLHDLPDYSAKSFAELCEMSDKGYKLQIFKGRLRNRWYWVKEGEEPIEAKYV